MDYSTIPADMRKRAALFPSMQWPQQTRLLREILEAECATGGKTWAAAEKARAPFVALRERLQRIHDAQVAAWVNS